MFDRDRFLQLKKKLRAHDRGLRRYEKVVNAYSDSPEVQKIDAEISALIPVLRDDDVNWKIAATRIDELSLAQARAQGLSERQLANRDARIEAEVDDALEFDEHLCVSHLKRNKWEKMAAIFRWNMLRDDPDARALYIRIRKRAQGGAGFSQALLGRLYEQAEGLPDRWPLVLEWICRARMLDELYPDWFFDAPEGKA